MKATAAARPYAYARPTALSSTFSLPPCSGSFGVSTPGEEGSRRKASAYKSRFVENKNHFGGRIARLRAIDGRSGARLVDLSTPSWKGKRKKKREERKETRPGLSRFFFSNGPDFHRGFHAFPPRHAPSFPLLPFPSFFLAYEYRFLSRIVRYSAPLLEANFRVDSKGFNARLNERLDAQPAGNTQINGRIPFTVHPRRDPSSLCPSRSASE